MSPIKLSLPRTIPGMQLLHASILVILCAACGFQPPVAESMGESGTEQADGGSGRSTEPGMAPDADPSDEAGSGSGDGSGQDAPMVVLEAATFQMGCDPAVDAICSDQAQHPHILTERPIHEVSLSAFAIDVHEVTLAAYSTCVEGGGCTPPGENWPECNVLAADHDDHPVDCVTPQQAQAFCTWVGKRLPTEAEWEYAARGDDQRIYPWGSMLPDCSVANIHFAEHAGCGTGDTYAVGSLPGGQSPFGLMDMSGNVAEIVADYFSADYYEQSPSMDPTGPESGDMWVLRGGGYNFPLDPWMLRVSARTTVDDTVPSPQIGFRCAADVE